MNGFSIPQFSSDDSGEWQEQFWLNHPIRAVFNNGEWWFLADDICAALGIDRSQVRRLDDDEKGLYSTHTPVESAVVIRLGYRLHAQPLRGLFKTRTD